MPCLMTSFWICNRQYVSSSNEWALYTTCTLISSSIKQKWYICTPLLTSCIVIFVCDASGKIKGLKTFYENWLIYVINNWSFLSNDQIIDRFFIIIKLIFHCCYYTDRYTGPGSWIDSVFSIPVSSDLADLASRVS